MDAGERDTGPPSWLKPVAGGAAIVVLLGIALAALGARPSTPEGAGLPVLLPSEAPVATQRADESDAAPSPDGPATARDTDGGPDGTRSGGQGGADDGRAADGRGADGRGSGAEVQPKVAVQVFDTQAGQCPRTFDVGVNAYVVKGQIDEGFAELSVPADRIRRSRSLLDVAGDFSAIIYGVPTKRTATLKLTFRGPAGEVTEVHDITHACPGKPVDPKKEKGPWGQLEQLAGPKKDMDFEFDFGPKEERTADRGR